MSIRMGVDVERNKRPLGPRSAGSINMSTGARRLSGRSECRAEQGQGKDDPVSLS